MNENIIREYVENWISGQDPSSLPCPLHIMSEERELSAGMIAKYCPTVRQAMLYRVANHQNVTLNYIKDDLLLVGMKNKRFKDKAMFIIHAYDTYSLRQATYTNCPTIQKPSEYTLQPINHRTTPSTLPLSERRGS